LKAQHVSSGIPLIIRSSKLYLQPLVYIRMWWPAVVKFNAFWYPKRYAFGIPECTIKFWYIGSVLWKAWWCLNRVETCCHKNILCSNLLCLAEIYTLYEYTYFVISSVLLPLKMCRALTLKFVLCMNVHIVLYLVYYCLGKCAGH